MRLNQGKSVAAVDALCRNAELEFGSRMTAIAQAAARWDFANRLKDAFKLVSHDPSAAHNPPLLVHEALEDIRAEFNKQYGLGKNKKSSIVGKQLPFILFSIILGENDVPLAERCMESTERRAAAFRDDMRKGFYDIRHSLFVHEDFVLPQFRDEPVPRVQLSRKYIGNAEFCAKKPRNKNASYYSSAKFLVALAGAYLNTVMTSIHAYDAGLSLVPEEVEGLVSAVEKAASSCINPRVASEIRSRVHGMCKRASAEFLEHDEIEGGIEYSARIMDAILPLHQAEKQGVYGRSRGTDGGYRKGSRRK